MKKEKVKEYEDLSFSDRFIFGKVMEDSARCQRLLECLLDQNIGELHEVTAERQSISLTALMREMIFRNRLKVSMSLYEPERRQTN